MAIYHLSVKNVSRGKGQSSVASAAYRSGEKLDDQRIGKTFDYTRKERVLHTEIITPDDSELSRSDLWNKVEDSEKRHNSRVAREFEVALPRELSLYEQKELARDFAKQLADEHGIVADIAIHSDKENANPHAHILCSTRRFKGGSFTDKAREFDDKISGPELVESWRERWATTTNQHLEKSGSLSTINHKSYADQGIDKVATRHLGHEASALEKQGIQTEIGNYNRQANFINSLKDQVKDLARSTKEKISGIWSKAQDALKAPSEVKKDNLWTGANNSVNHLKTDLAKPDAVKSNDPNLSR